MSLIISNIDSWKLDPLAAVSPQLRVILRSRIIRNDLTPGSRISEPELAKEYEVSRQPVREAFITLVDEGLLEIRPQRGTFVKKIRSSDVLNGRFVREAVEADIVKRVALEPDRRVISDLRSQLKDQSRVAKSDPAAFIELDETFHRTLARAAGHEPAWIYLQSIKSQMDRVRFISFEEFPISALLDQHHEIVESIAEGNPASAEAAMRNHLSEILNSLPQIQKLYPDYFDGPGEAAT